MRIGHLILASTLAASVLEAQRDTVVRAAGRPVHGGVAELRPELRIGVVDGDENYMIGAIDDVAVAANGTMYVLDRSIPAVRIYDAAGKFVKNVGRRGSGPGEFRAAAAISLAPNGNLLLWDPGNARINVYTSSGDVVTSWPTMGGTGSASGRGLLITDTTGTSYVRTHIFPRDRQVVATGTQAWTRFSPEGKLRDTVYEPAGPAEAVLSARRGGQFASRMVPFSPRYHSAVSPLGYFVTGYASRLAIELHEPGKPIASIRREVPVQSVSGRERDSARSSITESMRELDPAWSWNSSDIPTTKPAYRALYVGRDGRMWVELAKGPRVEDDSTALGRGNVMVTQQRAGGGQGPGRGPSMSWGCPSDGWSLSDVYEPGGRYLGQVRIPQKVEPIVIRGDFVWAATCNEDDAPQVVRYRIVWR